MQQLWRIIRALLDFEGAVSIWKTIAGGGLLSTLSAVVAYIKDAPIWLIIIIGFVVCVSVVVGSVLFQNWYIGKRKSKHISVKVKKITPEELKERKLLSDLWATVNSLYDNSENLVRRAAENYVRHYPINEEVIQHLLATKRNPALEELWDKELEQTRICIRELTSAIGNDSLEIQMDCFLDDSATFDALRTNLLIAQEHSKELKDYDLFEAADAIRELKVKKVLSKRTLLEHINRLKKGGRG